MTATITQDELKEKLESQKIYSGKGRKDGK